MPSFSCPLVPFVTQAPLPRTGVDVGLIHIAAMSIVSPSGDELAWLEKDLAAANANRDKVPWIIVPSHYQIYLSSISEDEQACSAAVRQTSLLAPFSLSTPRA